MFGKIGTHPVKDHGSTPLHDDGQDGESSWPDYTPPPHDDIPDLPPVKNVITFWLHKIFGGHHDPPPPDAHDVPQIIDAEHTGKSRKATAPNC